MTNDQLNELMNERTHIVRKKKYKEIEKRPAWQISLRKPFNTLVWEEIFISFHVGSSCFEKCLLISHSTIHGDYLGQACAAFELYLSEITDDDEQSG